MLPDVSIIVTCYNYGSYLERCLRSIYNQKHTDYFSYEVIVVNDCSSDETIYVCNKFEKIVDDLKVINHIKNQGISKSCNEAIQASNSRYIVRIDADDYVARHFIFLLKYALDKNRYCQAFCCDYIEVDDFENPIRQVSALEEEIACAVMYRKEFLLDIGLYNEEFKYREGHELNQRFKAKYKMGYLPIPLYYARKHGKNRSNDNEICEYDNKLKEEKNE